MTMKYRTIVIDPPWKFGEHGMEMPMQGGILKHSPPYNVMSDEEIARFPINKFAEENCGLFMWTTHTKLHVALDIIENWKFKYHVLLSWDKKGGMNWLGFYRRTELVIFAYRGKFNIDKGVGSYIPTLFGEKAKGHSEKPDCFYSFLRERTPEPRIDIFARKRHYGFDAYGDEVESTIQLPLLQLDKSNHSVSTS
jgi:site-specific DNA-methyltransferase (adenine-specific)